MNREKYIRVKKLLDEADALVSQAKKESDAARKSALIDAAEKLALEACELKRPIWVKIIHHPGFAWFWGIWNAYYLVDNLYNGNYFLATISLCGVLLCSWKPN